MTTSFIIIAIYNYLASPCPTEHIVSSAAWFSKRVIPYTLRTSTRSVISLLTWNHTYYQEVRHDHNFPSSSSNQSQEQLNRLLSSQSWNQWQLDLLSESESDNASSLLSNNVDDPLPALLRALFRAQFAHSRFAHDISQQPCSYCPGMLTSCRVCWAVEVTWIDRGGTVS